MLYEGVVTSIDEGLLKLQLDNNVIVYMGLLFAYSKIDYFPTYGDKATISSEHHEIVNKVPVIHLCPKSTLHCKNKSFTPFDNGVPTLITFIRKYNLGIHDLSTIDTISTRLQQTFELRVQDYSLLVLNLLEELLKGKNVQNSICKCSNTVLKTLPFKLISECQAVPANNKPGSQIPHWSFGRHKTEMLIGFLRVSSKFGLMFLEDARFKMACIIYKNPGNDLNYLVNRVVLVRSCYVFAEVFDDVSEKPSNIEYLVCDSKDVTPLLSRTTEEIVYTCLLPSEVSGMRCMRFILVNKSSFSVNNQKETVCWLEIIKLNSERQGENCFLCIKNSMLKVVLLLNIGSCYSIYYSKVFEKCQDYKIKRLSSRNMYLLTDENAKFSEQFEPHEVPTKEILSVDELINNIKTQTELVSFQGIITRKKFIKPQKSDRTNYFSKQIGFGTNGERTHQLEFKGTNGYFVLFLNNWDNLQVPLGLLPGMRVAVTGVLVQKGTYLKSTSLTRFEVLGYEPTVAFESVKVFAKENSSDWGRHSYLGDGTRIPEGVLIWGPVLSVFVRSLKIACSCAVCKHIKSSRTYCVNCRTDTKLVVDTTLTMLVHDVKGPASIICRNPEVVKLVLEISDHEWEFICDNLLSVGVYCSNTRNSVTELSLQSLLDTYINVVNSSGQSNLDLMCRNLENNEKGSEVPLWMCIEARMSTSRKQLHEIASRCDR